MKTDLFFEKIEKTPNGCWEWTGTRDKDGYGLFFCSGHKRAHRFSFAHFMGPIMKGAFVCHRCDNPPCVNPSHLFLGSPLMNMQDKMRKGRFKGCGKLFRTHCPEGHEYNLENAYKDKKGCLQCRICRRESYKKYYDSNSERIIKTKRERMKAAPNVGG